ncbi:MAG: hypothetical protein E7293_03700 [Lachnospiraceae bacterium]|nr:hypothetical protein [Lachnospiraceae bacterium]
MKKVSGIQLPQIKGRAVKIEYFPTRMQAFIFRNWDIVPKERLALVLQTNVENVEKQAEKMGLPKQKDVSAWLRLGYISIIRANWHLLSYDQLLCLLGWNEDRLALVLKEEDFLDNKLGFVKPECDQLVYRELTEMEEERTRLLKKSMEKHLIKCDNEREPFDFYSAHLEDTFIHPCEEYDFIIDSSWGIEDITEDDVVPDMVARFCKNIYSRWQVSLKGKGDQKIVLRLIEEEEEYHRIFLERDKIVIEAADSAGILRALMFLEDMSLQNGGMYFRCGDIRRRPSFRTRFIYAFSGLYNDALDVPSTVFCPDSLLESYARTGINGIWIQAVLYRLTVFPFLPSLSEGWELRLNHLKDFVSRAKRFGIKIYLYINEPRAMPLQFFDQYPELLGNSRDGYGCLCTSQPDIQNYLAEGIAKVCECVPDLGGFFTITRSENITNCYSLNTKMTCPRCRSRKQYEVIAEVNRIIAESAHKINSNIKVIAWDWSWRMGDFMNAQEVDKCISLMPKDVILMSNRETELPTNVGGIEGKVNDYSISACGIGDIARREWKHARNTGHACAAKLQINNSWECSTIPYLPVYSLLTENMKELKKEGVEHLMLSWTLGGYPSPNIRIVSELFFDTEGTEDSCIDIYKTLYGQYSKNVREATDIFSDAFREFPFDIDTLYFGPQNGGVSNPLFLQPTGFSSTMTCYAYDDLKRWRSIYPEEIFENQFKVLSEKWAVGLQKLQPLPECELKDIAYCTYAQFKSSWNQIRFIRTRERYVTNPDGSDQKLLLEILEDEIKLATAVCAIMKRNPSIGYEAANHYYYTQGMLMEKVINCCWLHEMLKK